MSDTTARRDPVTTNAGASRTSRATRRSGAPPRRAVSRSTTSPAHSATPKSTRKEANVPTGPSVDNGPALVRRVIAAVPVATANV